MQQNLFLKMPIDVLKNSNCAVLEKLVLSYMYDLLEKSIYKKQKDYRGYYYITLSIERLSKFFNVSRQTISKTLKSLEEKNFFKKTSRGTVLSSRYFLLDASNTPYSQNNVFENKKYLKIFNLLFTDSYKKMNHITKLVFCVLYDTSHLSENKKNYQEEGEPFVIKRQKELAHLLSVSLRSISFSFSCLVKNNLLIYKRIGKTLANQIFKIKELFNSVLTRNTEAIYKFFKQSDVQKLESDVQKINIYKTKNNRLRFNLTRKDKFKRLVILERKSITKKKTIDFHSSKLFQKIKGYPISLFKFLKTKFLV